MYTLGGFRFIVYKFSSTLFNMKLMEKLRFILSKFSSNPSDLKLMDKYEASEFNTLFDPNTMEKTAEDLSFDVLWLIFANLELPDLVRAGSVCSIWRDIYTSLCNSGSYNPQHTPCLLYTSESAGTKAACLYSLAEKKTYTLTLPDPPLCSRYIFGSSYGWIVTADERSELHIVNPITGDQIALPSVTTIDQVKPIFSDIGVVCGYEHSGYSGVWEVSDIPSIFDLSELRDHLFHKVFLSSDPSAGDYFMVLIHNPHCQLSFARAGDDKWTWLPQGDSYDDCLFNGQLLYACTQLGEIHEFDLGTPTITHKIFLGRVKDLYDEKIYMVQASCGQMLQIWRSDDTIEEGDNEDEYDPDFGPDLPWHSTSMIKVYKLEPTSKKLVEISSLGANVLFLGHNLSLCLHAEEHPQLKANHIYFADDEPYTYFKSKRRDIGVFDLERNCSEKIVSPQLWSNWPAPVWLVPNPRRIGLSLCK
jgi:hypothetical protein|uniref:F-box protein n=2 Tax=Zea mays TaxID=4577 RepID=A0A804M099_MAIZE